jgi:hypothetical protein
MREARGVGLAFTFRLKYPQKSDPCLRIMIMIIVMIIMFYWHSLDHGLGGSSFNPTKDHVFSLSLYHHAYLSLFIDFTSFCE